MARAAAGAGEKRPLVVRPVAGQQHGDDLIGLRPGAGAALDTASDLPIMTMHIQN